MTVAAVIVCEETHRWAAALRCVLQSVGMSPDRSVRIHEVRNVEEGWRHLDQAPASLLAIELECLKPDDWRRWTNLSHWYPRAWSIILRSKGEGDQPWLLRELGATHVVSTTNELADVAQMLQRHVRRLPEVEEGLRDRVWQRLPWG